MIPESVYREVVVLGKGRPGSQEIPKADGITIRSVKNLDRVQHLNLGSGETEAIALSLEMNADLLLLDEVKARHEARILGVIFVGVLGVLVEAKARSLINVVKPILDNLQNEAGFRISRTWAKRERWLVGGACDGNRGGCHPRFSACKLNLDQSNLIGESEIANGGDGELGAKFFSFPGMRA